MRCTEGVAALVLAVAVSYERLWWTLGATLLGFLQPAAIIYKLEEVFRERGDPSSTMYEQVWLSALVPAFAMTIVVRLAMARLTLRVAYGTYGKGMKGKDPYARDISVPRELKVHLVRTKSLPQEQLRLQRFHIEVLRGAPSAVRGPAF